MFNGGLRVQLRVVVPVLLVLQMAHIDFGILTTLRICLAKDVVGQNSVAETCVSRQRLAQFHCINPSLTVRLTILIDHTKLLVAITLV